MPLMNGLASMWIPHFTLGSGIRTTCPKPGTCAHAFPLRSSRRVASYCRCIDHLTHRVQHISIVPLRVMETIRGNLLAMRDALHLAEQLCIDSVDSQRSRLERMIPVLVGDPQFTFPQKIWLLYGQDGPLFGKSPISTTVIPAQSVVGCSSSNCLSQGLRCTLKRNFRVEVPLDIIVRVSPATCPRFPTRISMQSSSLSTSNSLPSGGG